MGVPADQPREGVKYLGEDLNFWTQGFPGGKKGRIAQLGDITSGELKL